MTTPPDSHKRVRLGLLVNRRARRMRDPRRRDALLSAATGMPVAAPSSVDELPSALDALLREDGVNVLAVAGGDGTLHYALNALRGVDDERWPIIAPLSGGTLNIVARTARVREQPELTLNRIRQRFEGRRLQHLPLRRVRVLEVREQGRAPRFGFVFGSETLHHAIELYVRFGAGYFGLSRFLMELTRGATMNSPLWRDESWKMGPHPGPLTLDGERWPSYLAAVATTVDLSLAIFAIRAIEVSQGAEGFFAKVLEDASAREVLTQIPQLLMNRASKRVVDRPESQRMSLVGPYTLDGELFGDPFARPRLEVSVQVADEPLRLLVP